MAKTPFRWRTGRLHSLHIGAVILVIGLAAGVVLVVFGVLPERHSSLIEVGLPRDFYNLVEPVCYERHDFCLVQGTAGQIVALYLYDTHQVFRRQACHVIWRPDYVWGRGIEGVDSRGWFIANCSGSIFHRDGTRAFGPSPRDLDRFQVIFHQGSLRVDLSHLICGQSRVTPAQWGCEKVPR